MFRRLVWGSVNTSTDEQSFKTMLEDIEASAVSTIEINNPKLTIEQVSKLSTTLKSAGAKQLTKLSISSDIEEKSIIELAEGIAAVASLTELKVMNESVKLGQSSANLAAEISTVFQKKNAKVSEVKPKRTYAQVAAATVVPMKVNPEPMSEPKPVIQSKESMAEVEASQKAFKNFVRLVAREERNIAEAESAKLESEWHDICDFSDLKSKPSPSSSVSGKGFAGTLYGSTAPNLQLQSVSAPAPESLHDATASLPRPGKVAGALS